MPEKLIYLTKGIDSKVFLDEQNEFVYYVYPRLSYDQAVFHQDITNKCVSFAQRNSLNLNGIPVRINPILDVFQGKRYPIAKAKFVRDPNVLTIISGNIKEPPAERLMEFIRTEREKCILEEHDLLSPNPENKDDRLFSIRNALNILRIKLETEFSVVEINIDPINVKLDLQGYTFIITDISSDNAKLQTKE